MAKFGVIGPSEKVTKDPGDANLGALKGKPDVAGLAFMEILKSMGTAGEAVKILNIGDLQKIFPNID